LTSFTGKSFFGRILVDYKKNNTAVLYGADTKICLLFQILARGQGVVLIF